MKAAAIKFDKRMGVLGVQLLTKAALCAATVGLIAGMAAVLLSHAE